MLRKVRDYIIENRMTEPGDIIMAGVSGGGDSMAMLSILRELRKELGIEVRAVHVHHGIRGDEADRDLHLTEETCKAWEIPFRAYFYDVPAISKERKTGSEETGRLVRKEAFAAERDMYEAQGRKVKTALAHNQEDLAETMLHNLARGTGLRGLSTMRPVSGEIIRPVLCLGRKEIAYYLRENNIPHITDSSNLSDDYTRNRIRHHILPLMEQEINTKAAAHMAETALRLSAAEDYLSDRGRKLIEKSRCEDNTYMLDDNFFREEEIIKRYALMEGFEVLAGQRKDFAAVHLKKVLELEAMQTGRCISLPYNLCAEKTYEGVRLSVKKKENMSVKTVQEWEVPVQGTLRCPLGSFEIKIFPYTGQKIEEKTYTKWLDYDRMKCNPCIRTRKEGDYLMVSSGDGGEVRKKLNRFMIDGKIPAEERDHIPLAVCEGEVLWMVGYRMNDRYKITPDTKTVLELKYQGGYVNE